jgi:hypothetical protein
MARLPANNIKVSTTIYQHRLNRLKLQIKSALIGLIHDKAMSSSSTLYEDGEATTLMSTDVDGLDGIAGMFHETWAQILEVVIGVVLLAREVGWIWPLPLVLIFRKSQVSPTILLLLRYYSLFSNEPLCGEKYEISSERLE